MPHDRNRQVIAELIRRLSFSRVVSIQGPRQCGKSFLAREILKNMVPDYRYTTLDIKQDRNFAQENPSVFLSRFSDCKTLAIDEAQKAPDLFDEIKAQVDINRRPGQYLLLGSTEFSREVLVRESLTGRLSRQRLFPLNLGEAVELKPQRGASKDNGFTFHAKPRIERKIFVRLLNQGGMPAIFSIRSQDECEQKLQEWVDVTVFRDLLQFKKVRPDPELAMNILEAIATLELPDVSNIRAAVKKDLRRVKLHLNLLEQLFVLHRLNPHPAGTGKTIYLLCDSGIATRLGANFSRQLYTQLVLEVFSRSSYDSQSFINTKYSYYRSAKGGLLHLIVDTPKLTQAVQIIPHEKWDERLFQVLDSFEKKNGTSSKIIKKVALFGGQGSLKFRNTQVHPWESLA